MADALPEGDLTDEQQRKIADRWVRVQAEVAQAAQLAGRQPSEVTIVGVTKYVPLSAALALHHAGCRQLGESRPQQLWERAEALRDQSIAWHMIGHLQRNKVPRTIAVSQLVHSVDSERLLLAIDQAAAAAGSRCRCLLEVKVAQDESKHGIAPEDLEGVLHLAAQRSHVEIVGLMTMASLDGTLEQARREFAQLRVLRDQIASKFPEWPLKELSMGMSHDFREAIAEGATLVRIGSHFWEGILM